jgi:hypothetical protein
VRLVLRLILIPLGLALAIVASTTFLLAASLFTPEIAQALIGGLFDAFDALMAGAIDDPDSVERFGALMVGLSRMSGLIILLPPIVVAAASEVMGWRSLTLQAAACALLTVLIPWLVLPQVMAGAALAGRVSAILFAAGAVAGSVYWLVAGRGAGFGAGRASA